MKTTIVGSQFHAGAIAALAKIKKGADQLHLGFVPRADNAELARAIDARRPFAVRLVDEAVIDRGKVVFAPKIEIREA